MRVARSIMHLEREVLASFHAAAGLARVRLGLPCLATFPVVLDPPAYKERLQATVLRLLQEDRPGRPAPIIQVDIAVVTGAAAVAAAGEMAPLAEAGLQ